MSYHQWDPTNRFLPPLPTLSLSLSLSLSTPVEIEQIYIRGNVWGNTITNSTSDPKTPTTVMGAIKNLSIILIAATILIASAMADFRKDSDFMETFRFGKIFVKSTTTISFLGLQLPKKFCYKTIEDWKIESKCVFSFLVHFYFILIISIQSKSKKKLKVWLT